MNLYNIAQLSKLLKIGKSSILKAIDYLKIMPIEIKANNVKYFNEKQVESINAFISFWKVLTLSEKQEFGCYIKYGVINVMQDKNIKIQASNNFYKKYAEGTLERVKLHNIKINMFSQKDKENISKKVSNYLLNRSDKQKQDTLNKSYDTQITKYGGWSSQNIDIKNKQVQTWKKTYSEKSDKEKDEWHKKASRNGIEKRNKTWQLKSKEEKEKIIKSRKWHKYKYHNILFDSKWEIYYWQYLIDNNINFIYHPNKSFSYKIDNREHLYFPDFEVNNKIIETKGSHLLKESFTPKEKIQCIRENAQTISNKEILVYKRWFNINYPNIDLNNFRTL